MSEGVVGDLPTLDYMEEFNPSYAEKDFIDHSHRQVYVGLHHRPAEKSLRRGAKLPKFSLRQPPKGFRWENGKKTAKHVEDSASEAEIEVDTAPAPASERVKFILGNEEEEIVQENPHLFTELEELFVYLDGNVEWKETARWYKYEEDVEEGGDRWSKPHVATLSLYSLLELRSSLMAGTVMLDMDASTLADVADLVINNLISCNKLEEIFRHKVRDTLLRKHRHHRSTGFRRNLSNIMSSRKSSNMVNGVGFSNSKLNKESNHTLNGFLNVENSTNKTDQIPSSDGKIKLFRNYSQPAFPTPPTLNSHPNFERSTSAQGHLVYPPPVASADDDGNDKTPGFWKKLPPNSEASNILVGEVDFLEKPITAFVRLSTSAVIGDLTEVPIPTRFLFIMLGPGVSPGRYHEIGRAISTLMADEVFHDVAYKAKSREDLIAGIDEFLEQVVVLPPGEWDPSIRINPPTNGVTKLSRRQTVENKTTDNAYIQEQNGGQSDKSSSLENDGSNPLIKPTRCFSSLIHDLKNWKNRSRDIKDGISLKCIGTVFLLYLSLLAIITTIGAYQEELTGGHLGVREHLLSLVITGIPFALLGGQPLLIMSFTMPVALFDGLLYNLSDDFSIDYLPFRLWIGIWTMLLLVVVVAFNISKYIHYLTQFTLEIFIVVSPLVLIGYGVVYACKVITEYAKLPGTFVNQTCQCFHKMEGTQNQTSIINGTMVTELVNQTLYQLMNVDLRDCILNEWTLIGEACEYGVLPGNLLIVVSTVLLVLAFSSIQHFGFLPAKVHQFFHNYATFLVVVTISLITNQFNTNIPYLLVPKHFQPADGSWVVAGLGENEAWIIVLAFLPAVFLTMLIMAEQQVTASCVNRNRNLLKKSHGYHLDLLVVLLSVGVQAILGLPFSVACVIFSLNHMQSLKDRTNVDDFIGGFTSVREQRLTSLLVYILIALTPTLQPILKYIPIPVLYGILIVVICRTFHGVKFVKRFTLLFIPKMQQPDVIYLRQVPLISVKILTVVQMLGLISCWALRASPGAIVFPFMLILLVVIRSFMENVLPLHDILVIDEPMPKISCCWKKSDSALNLITDIESGALLEETQKHEDVLHDHNKTMDRVNISEELSKTAAWKQLTYAENNSPLSNSPKDDASDNTKKRRKKRTRDSVRSREGSPKSRRKTSSTKKPELELVEYEDFAEKDHLPFKKQVSKERKRHESKDRGSIKRQGSHDRKHKQPKVPEEETPLPPWELPYHSPPRKDFGLLKIPEDDLSFDPACSRSDSVENSQPPSDHSGGQSKIGTPETTSRTLSPEGSRDASSEQD